MFLFDSRQVIIDLSTLIVKLFYFESSKILDISSIFDKYKG